MTSSLSDNALDKAKRAIVWSFVHHLPARDSITTSNVQTDAGKLKLAFSSWGNCMQAVYCKWPVIAVIIVGGLIIFGVLWCIIRCAFCGMACCCSCCHCLKCCGECCGCCDPPKSARHKYQDDPQAPASQGYRFQAPMQAPFAAGGAQYAEFDVSKKGGEDALPEMPSWGTADSKKVMLEHEALEMDQLKSPAADSDYPLLNEPHGGLSGQNSPLPANHQNHLTSLHGPQGVERGYTQARSQPISPDPYSPLNQAQGYGGPHDQRRESIGFGLDEPYDIHSDASTDAAVSVMDAHSAPSLASAPGSRAPNHMGQGYVDMPTPAYEHPADDVHMQQSSRGQRRPPPGTLGGGPPGYAMRRQGTGESTRNGPVPYGLDPMMRKTPAQGARRTPNSPNPRNPAYSQAPRQSPGPQNTYGYDQESGFSRPPPRDQVIRSFSPAVSRPSRDPVDRHYSPAAPPGAPLGRQYSPAPNRTYAQPPSRQASRTPDRSFVPASNHAHSLSPGRRVDMAPPPDRYMARHDDVPDSPLTNNSGFDFLSGNSRPDTPKDGSPTTEMYPGHKPYRPTQA